MKTRPTTLQVTHPEQQVTVAQLPLKILRRQSLEQKLQLSTSTIYSKMKFNPKRPKDFDPTFPKRIKLGPRAVGWIEAEIDEWVNMRTK